MTETSMTPAPPVVTPPAPRKDRTWVVLCHLSALASFVLPHLGSVVGPLVIWLVKRDQDPEVNAHGKEVLNFNLSFLIWHAIAWVLCIVLIGFLLLPIVILLWLILVVVGSYKASEGTLYKYPLTIRIID